MPINPEVMFGVPIFAALLSALVTYSINTYFNLKAAQNDLTKDYLEDLKIIETLSLDYWLGDHQKDKARLIRVSHELRARLDTTAYFVNSAKANGAIIPKHNLKFKELDGKLFDMATGGNFQTHLIAADPSVAANIVNITSEIRSLLRESKVARYRVH